MADGEYVFVRRDNEEWDRMWKALIELLKIRYGELWQTVFESTGYMGPSQSDQHCFRAKDVVFPDGEHIGRIYFEIPDGRKQAVA